MINLFFALHSRPLSQLFVQPEFFHHLPVYPPFGVFLLKSESFLVAISFVKSTDDGVTSDASLDLIMEPGMVFTIEPTIAEEKTDVGVDVDGWTVCTDSGAWTAAHEHTILITEV